MHSNRLCFSPHRAGKHRHWNTMPHLIVFLNRITVTKLSLKTSSEKKFAVKMYVMKLNQCEFSQRTFYRQELTHFQHFQRSGDGFVQDRNLKSFMFKLRVEKNKAGKVIDLKLYNVTFNIWIRTLGKSLRWTDLVDWASIQP